MSRYREIDLDRIKTNSISTRASKVESSQLARPVTGSADFQEFWRSLPDVLAAADLRKLVDTIVAAVQRDKPVLVMMGAHVIKVGLGPVLIDLMELGVIKGVAMNGAGAIHDTELAYFGKTSEDVAASLQDGSFGMASETAALLNDTIAAGVKEDLGFGEAMGRRIDREKPPRATHSILGRAYGLSLPVTVHVAMGTDIVHQHPSADGSAIGAASLRDFRIWADCVSALNDGGVLLHFGSSVLMPEVFLKALTVARNCRGPVENFFTANFDMIRHYRSRVNVVERPVQGTGRGFSFTGHHEIMIPLLAAALKLALK